MLVQMNTDKHVEGRDALAREVEAKVMDALERFGERITRVEVYFSDVNSDKGGSDDKRCVLEARPKGLDPIAVTHQAPTLELALNGATEKLKRALDSTFGKLSEY